MELEPEVQRELEMVDEFVEADSDDMDSDEQEGSDDEGEQSDSGSREEVDVPSDFASSDEDTTEDIEVSMITILIKRVYLSKGKQQQ